MDNEATISVGELYDKLVNFGCEVQSRNGYEFVAPEGIQILTDGNRYVKLVAVSRHKTPKHLIRITVHTNGYGIYDVTVTTDHVCMVYTRDRFFENTNAKNLNIGDYVQVYDPGYDKEVIGTISDLEDIGPTGDWVYDCEVDDDMHAFYADDVLVHNSQFVSIKCITEDWSMKNGLPGDIKKWPDEWKLKLWNHISDFVDKELNSYVQNLVKTWCHTEHPEVLAYALEYVANIGLYESKKHYSVAKVLSEGPEIVNKIKYSGIELKKASIPVKIKEYLGTIYSSTLTKDWTEADFKEYLSSIYPEFEKLDVEDISFWKGYTTFREADGFLHMKKTRNAETGKVVGDTAISTAATYYNQIIERLGIGDRYDAILLGDKVRFCYVRPTNKYGIKYIAFKDGQYPDEFREIFEVDYPVMWEKLIDNPLKNFLLATHFDSHGKFNPLKQNCMDVMDL